MKRYILIPLIFSLILLGGCTSETQHKNGSTSLILDETVIYPHHSPPIIKVKQGNDWLEISTIDDYSSPPLISPDKSKLAYISPYEFEMIGELWIYESGKQTATKEVDATVLEENQSIKDVLWVADEYLAFVTGYAFGTIPLNQAVYLIKLNDDHPQLLFEATEQQHIETISLSHSHTLLIDVQTYNESFTDFIETEDITLTLQDFID